MAAYALLHRLAYFFVLFGLFLAWDSSPETEERTVNAGENVTLLCFPQGTRENVQVMWVKDDRSERMKEGWIQGDGSLSLPSVGRDDSGIYTCAKDGLNASSDAEDLKAHDLAHVDSTVRSKYQLIVRTTPGPLINVTVHPSTVLATLMWDVGDTGNCEISYFTAQYRAEHATEWIDVIPRHIMPSTRQIDVYHLIPNTTYAFRIWATNEIGSGAEVIEDGTTRHAIEEIELARHLLEGVETFDTRVWVVAVSVVMGTLVVLSLGTCYLMFRDYHVTVWSAEEHEVMELVPNIILNPGYRDDLQRAAPDENCNDQPHVSFNNNSIVRPIRV